MNKSLNKSLNKSMNKITQGLTEFWRSPARWPMIIVVAAVFVLGLLLGGGSPSTGSAAIPDHNKQQETEANHIQTWTCSMHPQIQQPKPGKCPICFMDLVPVESGSAEDLGPRQLKLTPTAMKLAEIQTTPVVRRFAGTETRMVGKVTTDERRSGTITARVPGRIDRMVATYTGITVKKGDPLVSLYSPKLITAQQELLQALKNYKKYGTNQIMVAAAREKLKLWGLTPEQIQQVENRKKTTNHLTVYSPMTGIVIKKHGVEGMYIKTGTPIYTIAGLSHVWVTLDAYESDISRLRYGQAVEFETEAYPGQAFKGKIAFIHPVLNTQTRTVKVRLNVPNPGYRLKPGMFVRAVAQSTLSDSGEVMDPQAAATQTGNQNAPLLIPASAPLLTGERAVVYTAVPGKQGVFEGKEIILGPRAGDYYHVKAGLKEGEKVVIRGAFKIDSDLQIQAKPSMMHLTTRQVPTAFRQSIDEVAGAYFDIQQALSRDSLADGKKGAEKLLKKLAAVDMTILTTKLHRQWMTQGEKLKQHSQTLAQAQTIEAARVQLELITAPMAGAIQTFSSRQTPVYRLHCPMAFNNNGAFWLQDNPQTRNPYFGTSMLMCKDTVEVLVPEKVK